MSEKKKEREKGEKEDLKGKEIEETEAELQTTPDEVRRRITYPTLSLHDLSAKLSLPSSNFIFFPIERNWRAHYRFMFGEYRDGFARANRKHVSLAGRETLLFTNHGLEYSFSTPRHGLAIVHVIDSFFQIFQTIPMDRQLPSICHLEKCLDRVLSNGRASDGWPGSAESHPDEKPLRHRGNSKTWFDSWETLLWNRWIVFRGAVVSIVCDVSTLQSYGSRSR